LQERVEVVATRVPERPEEVPATIEVFTAQELVDRGATDLRSAVALAAGVDIAPGGDGGPASAVPEFWGLKEFDAFLLVVDGVPWGGAFNPALATLDFVDVERVEVMRGPAPVTFGGTSFVGVIHVVHKPAGASGGAATVRGGSFGSGAIAVAVPFRIGSVDSRLSADVDRQGFRDDRTSFRRAHVLWRNGRRGPRDGWWCNVDATWLGQDPASPHPRTGVELSPLVPVDANQNPAGAFLNETRAALMAGFDRKARSADWTLSTSVSRATQDQFRGFLASVTDIYADTHLAWTVTGTLRVVAGGDYLFGNGTAQGATFSYGVPLSGVPPPVVPEPGDLDVHITNRRHYAGAYGLVEWRPVPRVRIDGGIRLNVTNEVEEAGDEADAGGGDHGETHVRPSGSAGVMFTAWSRGSDIVRLYGSYRDTFKPAAFDFGLGEAEGEGGPLEPETARSVEGGVKTQWLSGRLNLDASAFMMDFKNLVIAQSVNGLPALANAGTERLTGIETSAVLFSSHNVSGRATYGFHDARFRSYLTEFDGVPTQLGGKRIEMSARHLASAGAMLAPSKGVIAGIEVTYVGSRYLNKRNTALAPGYGVLTLRGGYRLRQWELRADAQNLTDERAPVSESEIGDAQYYLMPARRIDVTLTARF
jgi:iron complex outermembrane receptor protein